MSFAIKPATAKDRDAILALITKLQDEESAMHASRLKGAEIAQDYYDLLQKNSARILVCRNDQGHIAGFVSGWLKHDDDFLQKEEWRHHGYISDVFVEKQYRRQGLASTLLAAIEEVLKEKGAQRFRICALCVNKEAVALYQKTGYIPFEITYDKPL